MKKSILLLVLVLVGQAFAQRVLLDEEVFLKEDETFGPNRQFFVHNVLAFGSFGTADNVPFTWQKSYWLESSARTKTRLTHWLAFCGNWGYRFNRVYIDNSDYGGPLIDVIPGVNTYLMHEAHLETCFRIVTRNRGNNLGTYLDFGLYGVWQFANSYRFKTEDSVFKDKVVDFDNRLYYGIQARLGNKKLAIPVRYRLIDMSEIADITTGETTRVIPELSIGLEFALY